MLGTKDETVLRGTAHPEVTTQLTQDPRKEKTRRSDRRVLIAKKEVLLLLMSHHSELLLPFMGSNLMLLSFSSTRHCRTPYVP